MKKLVSLALLAMMMVASKSFAQGSLLATLSHDGSIRAFYGASALKSALAAADNGDIITLSSGQFNAGNITKAVTLRGAGMSLNTDSINGHEATIIQNNFSISLADSLEGRLVMEGLYVKDAITYSGTIKNAQFLKCRFNSFAANTTTGSYGYLTNATFIHCRFYSLLSLGNSSSVFIINSLVNDLYNTSSTTNIELDNCFVKWDANAYNSSYLYPTFAHNVYYKNCILQLASSTNINTIPSSCTAYNCVGVGSYSGFLFSNMISSNKTNKYVSSLSTIFKTYKSTTVCIGDSDSFELTDAAATTYLGLDGTQVGVYGGNLVYDENPTIPQITKCNVAAKSTADGKLSVEIEVKAAEY